MCVCACVCESHSTSSVDRGKEDFSLATMIRVRHLPHFKLKRGSGRLSSRFYSPETTLPSRRFSITSGGNPHNTSSNWKRLFCQV